MARILLHQSSAFETKCTKCGKRYTIWKMQDQTLLQKTLVNLCETSSNGVAVGFARPQSVVVRPPSSGSVHIVRGQRTSKRGGYCCHRFCSVALPTPLPSLSVSPTPSGMVVYVLRPDRIVVCFRRRQGRKEQGRRKGWSALLCYALCSALLAVASMS